jgi:hypothetical protein
MWSSYFLSVLEAILVTAAVVAVVAGIYHFFEWELGTWMLAAWLLFVINLHEAKRDRQ